ncbi:hypothetical protein VTO73DRAFT_9821 [Trametes versicolor]
MPGYHARQVVYRVLCAFFTLYPADQDVRVENGLPIPPSRLAIERRGRGSAGRLGTDTKARNRILTTANPFDRTRTRYHDDGKIALGTRKHPDGSGTSLRANHGPVHAGGGGVLRAVRPKSSQNVTAAALLLAQPAPFGEFEQRYPLRRTTRFDEGKALKRRARAPMCFVACIPRIFGALASLLR